MTPEEIFLSQLELIERVITFTCKRNGLFGDDAEEFASTVKLKLIENDYAILKKFEGRSQLSTYLTTVILNLLRDYRVARWSKWRPSARARRQGEAAVALETLLYRDGVGLEEAISILRTNHGCSESEMELRELAGELSRPGRRTFEGLERITTTVAADSSAQEETRSRELRTTVRRTEQVLADALEALSGEDRLLLQLRFREGLKISEIARTLDLEQRPLYPRIDRCLKRLNERLQAAGLTPREVLDTVGWEGFEMKLGLDGENRRDASV